MKSARLLGGVLSAMCLVGAASSFTLVDEQGKADKQVQATQFFSSASRLNAAKIETDPQKLAMVARETLSYLRQHPQDPAAKSGILGHFNLSVKDVEKTLEKVIKTIEEDTRLKRSQRILNSAYLEKEFRLLQWQADVAGAQEHKVKLQERRLRITKYVVFEAKGQTQRSAQYACALYALPPDEEHLSVSEADSRKDHLIRYRFNKQEVVAGALDKLGVKPLVWLTRQGLEDALLQGSLMVVMPDGKRRMFNVHRNNGIAYDRKIKDPRQQARYWYFKEVRGILGYGPEDKVQVQPGVTFAGDVFNLGLGKLIAIRYPLKGKNTLKLGILADTGGAFIPNLYQLDFLSGIYPDRASFQKGIASLPEYADAFVLTAR